MILTTSSSYLSRDLAAQAVIFNEKYSTNISIVGVDRGLIYTSVLNDLVSENVYAGYIAPGTYYYYYDCNYIRLIIMHYYLQSINSLIYLFIFILFVYIHLFIYYLITY